MYMYVVQREIFLNVIERDDFLKWNLPVDQIWAKQ